MADEILITFKADTGDLDKAVGKIEKLTRLQAELKNEVNTTYSSKQLDDAIAKLNKQADVVGRLSGQYKAAVEQVKTLEEEINALTAANQQNTESFKQQQKVLSNTKTSAKELGAAVKDAAAKPEVFESVIGSVKALKTVFSSTGAIVKEMGLETTAYDKAAQELTGTIEQLEKAQALVNAVVGESGVYTKALTAAQAVYSFVVGESTGATKAFRLALAGTGIGLAVIAIGELAANWDKVKKVVFGAGQAIDSISSIQRQHNEITQTANQQAGDQIAHLKMLQQTMQDEKLPRRERLEALREYNILAADGNKIGEREIDVRDKINTQLDRQINLVLALATAKAAEDMLGQKITELLQLELKQRQDVAKGEAEIISANKKMNEAARNDETGNMTAYFEQQKNTAQATTFFNKLESEKRIADKKKEIEELLELLKGYKREATKLEGNAPGPKKREPETPVEAPELKTVTSIKSLTDDIQKQIDIQKIPTVKIEVETPMEKIKGFLNEYASEMQNAVANVSKVTNQLFGQQTQALDAELQTKLSGIDEVTAKQLEAAGSNAEMRQAIEERSAKKKADLEKRAAVEKAKIERKQAIANKVFAIFDIGIKMAQAIMRAYSDTGPIAGNVFAAITAAVGAAELAAVAAAPLPEIPKFEKGGPVALSGGRIADGHLYGRSHRQGGMLINAQGGEYIWDIPTVKKHGDLIRAAHENRLEDLIMHKYIVPAMQRTSQPVAQQNSYDDFMLRSTIKQGHEKERRNAEYIVKGITNGLTEANYFTKRFNS